MVVILASSGVLLLGLFITALGRAPDWQKRWPVWFISGVFACHLIFGIEGLLELRSFDDTSLDALLNVERRKEFPRFLEPDVPYLPGHRPKE